MDEKSNVESYKGHAKDTDRIAQKSTFLEKNQRFFVIHKKTEKLSLAVYMVTDFFDVREPLRWELRTKSVELLSLIMSLASGDSVQSRDGIFLKVFSEVDQLLVPLELAMRVRLISPMNFSILREEFLSLADFLRQGEKNNELWKGSLFPDRFFDTPELKDSSLSKRIKTPASREVGWVYDKGQKDIKRQVDSYKGQKTDFYSIDKEVKTNGSDMPKKDEKLLRSDTIKELLRTRGSLNIKDISKTIDDCSEKTIQRELVSLIVGGSVRRVGERRWSTYALVESHS